jgi:HlyD family secretion protein
MNLAPSAIRDTLALSRPRPGAEAYQQDDPEPDLRLGWLVVLLFFGLFLGWALFARLDAAAYAQGQISPQSHIQTIQHRDGGIVKAILVKDGQHVDAGQTLIQLQPTEVHANEASTQSQVISLMAQKARLEAEQAGRTQIIPPPEFASLPAEARPEAAQAMSLQAQELRTRTDSIASQKNVLKQRQAELEQQIIGYKKQVVATDEQSKSIAAELAGARQLASRGFSPLTRVRALERNAQGLDATRADLDANIAKSQQSIGEARMEALSLDSKHAEDVAKELRDVNSQLNDTTPKLTALKTQVANTVIKAPVSGQIVGLQVFTVGGVIAPGQKLMEIVPDKSPLIIDARFKPEDAPDLHVGQKVQVKFTALHDRAMPNIFGTITRFSADTLGDEKTNQRYYTAEVTVPPAQLAEVRKIHGGETALRSGLPVQVLAPLRKRTAFEYLMEPLNQSLWRSFREH